MGGWVSVPGRRRRCTAASDAPLPSLTEVAWRPLAQIIRDVVLVADPTVDIFRPDADGVSICHLACSSEWLLSFAHLFGDANLERT